MSLAAAPENKLLGFPVLKGAHFVKDDVDQQLEWWIDDEETLGCCKQKIDFNFDFHGGGYGKYDKELLGFMRGFYETHGIRLDPIYTGKLMAGIYHLVGQGQIAGARVLAVHTGGLQGIAGVELKTGRKLFGPQA
eukprot:752188-Hanusia_phi.AAC.2